MKRIGILLVIFANSIFAQNYCTLQLLPSALQTSLVAYYPFCGNANDASGNNNNASVTNATLTTDRFGNVSSSYDFNGTNAFIQSTTAFFNNNWNNYSISYWMNTSNTAKVYQSCFNTLPHNSLQMAYNFPGPQSNFVHFSANATPSVQTWNLTQYSQGTYSTYVNNQWYHIALTKNGTIWKFYVNGVLDAVFSSATPITTTLTNVMFGAIINPSTSLSDQFFQGRLDDIMIYNRTLNSVEVASLTCVLPSDPGPISGSIIACTGSQFTYSVAPVNGATSYSWVTPGNWTGTSTTNVINATPGVGGLFSLEAINVCGKSTAATLNVVVNSPPVITATTNVPLLCLGSGALLSASGASTYVWNPGGGMGAIIVANPTVTTTYTVTGTLNGCSSNTTITQNVTICNSLGERIGEDTSFNVYPNPSLGEISLQVMKQGGILEIYNSMGMKLKEYSTDKNSEELTIKLSAGIYFVTYLNKNGSAKSVKKVIIE